MKELDDHANLGLEWLVNERVGDSKTFFPSRTSWQPYASLGYITHIMIYSTECNLGMWFIMTPVSHTLTVN